MRDREVVIPRLIAQYRSEPHKVPFALWLRWQTLEGHHFSKPFRKEAEKRYEALLASCKEHG